MEIRLEMMSMQTRDGVRLDADVYRPEGDGDYPVLLMRQPYGRAIASTVVYAHPRWYAAHGYIVVIQDVRGRGTSEGKFRLFEHEIADGYDTVQWAAGLPGSNGRVGMYGFSYQGMTQLYAAIAQPPALVTLCPAMVGYDLYTDWAYEGGAFCLQANLGWALQISAETVRLRGNAAAYGALAQAAKNLRFDETIPARSPLLETLDPDSFYHDWLHHDQPDAYWEKLSPSSQFQAVDLPMLHIGGWYDTFMRGTLRLYQAMAARSVHRQQLIVGPWAHLPWSRHVGAVDFGPAADSPCDRLQLRWFDHYLKGPAHQNPNRKDPAPDRLTDPLIQLFDLGSHHWRAFPTWPLSTPTPLYLASTGLAALRADDGILSFSPAPPYGRCTNLPDTGLPDTGLPDTGLSDTGLSDTLVHDPWRPVPALGGHAALPSGPQNRAALDGRTDILTYTSPPLTTALTMVGVVQVELYCTAIAPSFDASSFDLCAILSAVHANGQVFNVTQGYQRLPAASVQNPVQITLQPTCVQIQPGHALRLSLSAAGFPAYPVNAGNGSPPGATPAIAQQIITLTLQSGGQYPSRVVLPLL